MSTTEILFRKLMRARALDARALKGNPSPWAADHAAQDLRAAQDYRDSAKRLAALRGGAK